MKKLAVLVLILVSHGIPGEGEIDEISLSPDRYIAEPGETLRMLVRSREKSIPALLVIQGDEFHEIRPIRIEPGCRFIEIEILPEHAPNLFVSLLAFKNGESIGESFEVFVYPPDRVFAVDVTAERDSYAPGETAEVVVTATAPDGSPVQSEVEISIVDESVLALRSDATQDIRTFFRTMRWKGAGEGLWDDEYSSQSFRWRFLALNYMVSGEASDGAPLFGKSEEGEQLFGGGVDEESDAAAPGVRKLFPDTLLYRAHARTGEEGRCTIEVETPGSLTTWRIVARAVAGADRFGQGTSSVITTKDVVLRLAAPRFLTVGDEGVVVGVLQSDLPERAEFTVSLAAEGVETAGEPRTVALEPGTETRLEFTVRAMVAGTAKLSASAMSPAGSDAMEIQIPVKAHGASIHVAQTGRVEGSLTLSPSLPADGTATDAALEFLVTSPAEAIRETLPFLAGYPYGCVEQTMSRFLPSVVAAGAMQRLGLSDPMLAERLPDMVDQGLQRLYRFQHEDGGFGWWENDETHPFMTAYVVYGLMSGVRSDICPESDIFGQRRVPARDMGQRREMTISPPSRRTG